MFDIFYINNKPDLPARKVNSENEARELSRTRYLWIVDGANNYSSFDFSWEPVPWEAEQRHVFKSQHQDNSGTCLIPVNGYEETNYREDLVKRENILEPFIFLDFGNTEAENSFKTVSKMSNNVTRTRFISSYHGTLSRIIKKVDSEYVWITASICDYDGFDFTWHPSEWNLEMFHVFASNNQKFGDTFYIHVPTFKEQVDKIELLEWYETIHFIKTPYVCRWGVQTVETKTESITDEIKQHQFKDPVYLFTNKPYYPFLLPTVNMWREKTRACVPLSDGNATALITRDAKNYVSKQVYDYPFINKEYKNYKDDDQDIVFLSYDELNAEENYKIISDRFPRTKRVHGVEGMDNALKEAARQSDTEWYYAVFAKTALHKDFDFSFKPDRFQEPKHYIFHAKNMMNGLEYGHMGIVLYNKNIILGMTDDFGIDYTMSAAHEVIPTVSANAVFNSSPYQTWRTAFRECSKLAQFNAETPSIDSEYRLDVWTTQAKGEYAEWCLNGANDGVEYYKQNAGNNTELMKAFRWDWLREYFVTKYGNID